MLARVALAPSAYAPHRGGVEEVAATLAGRFTGCGIGVSVTTMRWPKTLARRDRIDGIPVRRQLFRAHMGGARRRAVATVSHPVSLASLVAHYRAFAPTVVNIHCVSPAAQFHRQAAKILGIPLVVSVHGELKMDASQIYQREPRMQRILERCLADADAITACSEHALAELEDGFGSSLGGRAVVIHNGIDAGAFSGADPARRGRPYVFAVGRHVPQKGFDTLIDAYARTRLADRGIQLVLAGQGPDTAALRQLADELGLGAHVDFVGRTERAQTASLMRGARAVAVPSRQEPFGIVALEAMAAGTPLVASRVGGLPEFVEDGTNGVLVPVADADALARALVRLLDDGPLTTRLIEGGRRSADRHGWSRATNAYLATYQGAVRHHRAKAGRRTPL